MLFASLAFYAAQWLALSSGLTERGAGGNNAGKLGRKEAVFNSFRHKLISANCGAWYGRPSSCYKLLFHSLARFRDSLPMSRITLMYYSLNIAASSFPLVTDEKYICFPIHHSVKSWDLLFPQITINIISTITLFYSFTLIIIIL